MPGKQHGPSIKNPDTYDALREKGMSKAKAAAISNEAKTKKGRSTMAKKAAKTRERRGN
jgi:hypothetical protein